MLKGIKKILDRIGKKKPKKEIEGYKKAYGK